MTASSFQRRRMMISLVELNNPPDPSAIECAEVKMKKSRMIRLFFSKLAEPKGFEPRRIPHFFMSNQSEARD